jgi:Na+-transporting NADH:ubiquinone oxidoreductase subunit A
MKTITIKKGLDLPYLYKGNKQSFVSIDSSSVSVSGYDYPFKPNLLVGEGSTVRRGDFLFTTKDDERIGVTCPVSGKVSGIHRGERRALIAVSIDIDSSVDQSLGSSRVNSSTSLPNLNYSNRKEISITLANLGAWVYLRTRPFSLVPGLDEEPAHIFINAMDTRPGSIGMKSLLSGRAKYLQKGIHILSGLTKGKIYFCQDSQENWEDELHFDSIKQNVGDARWERVGFSGKHPSGLTSTHIHFLNPVSLKKNVWTIPADLLADMGEAWMTGVLPNQTRFSLSGPFWKNPSLLQTTIGSSVSKLVRDYLPSSETRVGIDSHYRIVSGSILHGWEAKGAWDFLGRFHNQISILKDENKREFLDWLLPAFKKFSITRTAFGRWFPKMIDWNTSQNGSPRAIVPIGNYERVMPLDILPTQLLRALVTEDWEEAVELGALELEEEDMSLLTYVCPGKKDYGKMLKEILKITRKELV